MNNGFYRSLFVVCFFFTTHVHAKVTTNVDVPEHSSVYANLKVKAGYTLGFVYDTVGLTSKAIGYNISFCTDTYVVITGETINNSRAFASSEDFFFTEKPQKISMVTNGRTKVAKFHLQKPTTFTITTVKKKQSFTLTENINSKYPLLVILQHDQEITVPKEQCGELIKANEVQIND